MAARPPGFIAVRDAPAQYSSRLGLPVNLIGVVVSLQDPRQSKGRGTDWYIDFTIQDDFSAGSVGGSSSMRCRVFKPQSDLPKITGIGDIAILREFKLTQWKERTECISQPLSGVLVFPADKIPVPELSQAYQLGTQRLPYNATPGAKQPTNQEQDAVLKLKHSSSGSAQEVRQHAALASIDTSNRRKEALIKDLTFDRFYDIKAEVVKLYYTNTGSVDLKVTDYTANKDLYEYVDPEIDRELAFKRDWPGPYGQVTLHMRLFEPHAAWARGSIKIGDFVYLRNVHTKLTQYRILEGVMHQDRQMPDQVDIRKLLDKQAIDEIKQRKDAYEQQRSNRGTVQVVNAPKKPSAKASAKKKAEKREKQRLQKAADLKEIEEKEETWEAERSGINLNSKLAQTIGMTFY